MSVFLNKKVAIDTQNGPAEIQYFVCEPLLKVGFINAFSTRMGGISSKPKNDLNMSYRSDEESIVNENRARLIKALNRNKPNPILSLRQTHSDKSIFIDGLDYATLEQTEGDALYSNKKAGFLGVKTADCLPILIGDPSSGVSCALHAGWKGTLNRITEKTIKSLLSHTQFNKESALVAVGPAACANCYEVGTDVKKMYEDEFEFSDVLLTKGKNPNKFNLNVGLANKNQLVQSGIEERNIFESHLCTMHQNNMFFSHRKEQNTDYGKTVGVGRLISIVGRAN